MCGICGKLFLNGNAEPVDSRFIASMMQAMHHRGPDDEGMYVSGRVGLGHKRLSIIDLNTGRQPISNEDATVHVVFNGEIYNFKELAADLRKKGHEFRTATDTEVIVHLYEEFGEGCVPRLRGMFSFALWDERKQLLLLARDRVGIKPLYYHLNSSALIFASEIKAILADGSVETTPDVTALSSFLTYFYTPGEKTLFKNIYKLSPGHYLTVKHGNATISQYWDLHFNGTRQVAAAGEYADNLVSLLHDTVRDHMISDVPVGVLLSGGVDSTAVLSFAVEQSLQRVSTFTLGFDKKLCTDERPYARIAAEKYNTDHHEITIGPKDFFEFLPQYVWFMEEPVCEPPAVALYYVSKLARDKGIKVLLSGEGGDEAFAGYQNYRNLTWLERLKAASGPLSGFLAAGLRGAGSVPALHRFKKYAPLVNLPLEQYYYSRTSNPFRYFNCDKGSLFTSDFLQWMNGNNPSAFSEKCFAAVSTNSHLNRMLYVDTKTWLPDDLLIKADKMTMANSLELRVPLLDHRVLEFAASLPASLKLKGFTTKYLFKKALASRIPAAIRDRKKTGFPVPYENWMRHEFKNEVMSVLTDPRTIRRGYFRQDAIEQLIAADSNGGNYSKEIFSLLTLELWQREFADRTGPVYSQ